MPTESHPSPNTETVEMERAEEFVHGASESALEPNTPAHPEPKVWPRERIDLIKRTVCPKGISDDEFAIFIEQCRRSGFDPLLKQAFCVKRRKNIGTKEEPNWVAFHEFQPAETGFLARAEEFADLEEVNAQAVYEKDEIQIDGAAAEVAHMYRPGPSRGKLLGAWGRVIRTGKKPVLVWLDLAGYQQNTTTWRGIPATMIEKCARVAALRKAYPSTFGGLYIAEEMRLDERPMTGRARLQSGAKNGQGERIRALWATAKGLGFTEESFPGFVAEVLGEPKASKALTGSDVLRLEKALADRKKAATVDGEREPGAEG